MNLPDSNTSACTASGLARNLVGARVHGGLEPGYISTPRASPLASLSSPHPQEHASTAHSPPDGPELEIELELRRLGSPLIRRYKPSPSLLSLNLAPQALTDRFPLVSPLCSCRKRPEPPTPEAPPPRDLVAGEPGCSGGYLHHHPNGDTSPSPMVPPAHLLVLCIAAGELVVASGRR